MIQGSQDFVNKMEIEKEKKKKKKEAYDGIGGFAGMPDFYISVNRIASDSENRVVN